MPTSSVPLKTPAGQDELRHRTLKLSQRHRTVLLLVDGRRSVSQVLSLALQAGAATSHFEELVRLGLVQLPQEAVAPEPVETAPGAFDLVRVQSLELDVPGDGGVEAEAASEPSPSREEPLPIELDPVWRDEPEGAAAVALPEPLPPAGPELQAEAPVETPLDSPVETPVEALRAAPLDLALEPQRPFPEEWPAEPKLRVLPQVTDFPQAPEPVLLPVPAAQPEPWMEEPLDRWATTAVLPPNVGTRGEAPLVEPTVPPAAAWPEFSAAAPLPNAPPESPPKPPMLRELPVRVLPVETTAPGHEPRFEGPNSEHQLLAHVGDLLSEALSFDAPLFSTRTLMRVRMAQTRRELIELVWEIEHQFQRSRRAHGGSAALYEAREMLGMGNTQVAGDSQAGWPDEEDT